MSTSHSLTLHNFSFRNDPLNAPKGQEIIRGFDEVVEIFPPLPKVEPVKTPDRIKDPSIGTSLSPSLPSGLLKVKMFGKMKERNAFDSPTQSEGQKSEIELEDEDFDLDIDPSPVSAASKTQTLGNSGVTITPISHLAKTKMNVHRPQASGGLEMAKKLKISPIR